MNEKYTIRATSIIDLDYETKLVHVEIDMPRPDWWCPQIARQEAVFTYVGEGIWLDEKNLVVVDTELRLKLQELLVGNIANQSLDRYIATP